MVRELRERRVSTVCRLLSVLAVCCVLLALGGCKAEMGKLGKFDLSALDFRKEKQVEEEKPAEPEVVPTITVAMLAPLPLPRAVSHEQKLHEKVLTSEFHSDANPVSYDTGYFIPREYLHIIQRNIDIAAEMRTLSVVHKETLGGIEPGDYDLIVMTAVTQARVDSAATIGLKAKIIDGKTFLPVRTIVVEEQMEERLDDPLQSPIHFVGSHMRDMQNQRTLFSQTAFECAKSLVDEIITGAAS